MTKQETLRNRYRTLIESGAYAPGERIPSIRDTARTSRVSVNTARAAYEFLERDGLIRARERGGYFVRSRRSFAAYEPPRTTFSGALSPSDKIDYIHDRGSAAAFALASPGPDLIPVSEISHLLASISIEALRYPPTAGDEELRSRITAWRHPFHRDLRPDDIIVTNGASEALSVTLRALIEPGDVVAVESPCYFDFPNHIRAAGALPLEIPLVPGLGMDPDQLDMECRRRKVRMAIVQPCVQNPTGTIAGIDGLDRFTEVAMKHGLAVIQDDVYAELAFSGEVSSALDTFGDIPEFVYLSSFSKILAPGLRIGWIATRGPFESILHAKRIASCAVSGPAQKVAAAFLAGKGWAKRFARMRNVLRERLTDYLELLREHLPDGSSIIPPKGGCLLWIGLPGGSDASRLFELCAAEGILVAPGELFSANPHFRGHFRVNFGYFLDEERRGELMRICAIARTV